MKNLLLTYKIFISQLIYAAQISAYQKKLKNVNPNPFSLFFLLVILLVLAFWLDMKRMKKKIVEVEEKSVQATIERTLSELNLAGDKSMPIADKTKPSKEKPKVSTPEKTPTNKDKLQTSFKREMPAELFTDRKVKAPWKAIVGKMKPSKEKLKMPEKTPTSNKGKLQPSFKREMPAELFTDRKVKSPWKEEKDDKKQGNVKHPVKTKCIVCPIRS